MKKNVESVFIILAIILLVVFSCKLVEDSGESSQGVNALRMSASDVSPWTEELDGFKPFTASTMQGTVNGGAPEYVDKGLVAGFEQKMENKPKSVTLLILDFGTEAKAIAMYKQTVNELSDKSDAGTYPQSVAQLDNEAMSGVTAIAHFGKYYLELAFLGYSDKSESRVTATNFVEVFEAKISALSQ